MLVLMGQSNPLVDTVLISSQRIPQTAEQSGRDLTIISGKDLMDLPIASLDELLRYLPGVNVQARGGFGTQGDISLRGSTFSQVLMLIDGIRINDPLTGHFNNYLPIAPSEIKRIEIVYGPSAALYGPDAVGGVIHIITHNFDGAEKQDGIGEAQLLVGEYGLWGVQAGGGSATKLGYLNAGVQYQQAAGQPLPPDSTDILSDFQILTTSLSLRKDIGKFSYAVRAAYDSRLFNAQYYYTTSPFDLSREEVRQFWSQARLTQRHKHGETSLDLAYKTTRDSFLFNPAFPANIHRTQFAIAMLNHQRSLGSLGSIAGGLQADLRDINSTDRGDHNNLHWGAYLTAFLQPVEDLSINTSLRADQDNNYGFELSPQVSLAYQLDKVAFRAMGGRAVRAADFTERFVSSQISLLSPGRNLGNPDLEAERAWHAEIGTDIRPTPGIRLSITGFYRQDNNLIDYGLTNSNDIPNATNLEPDADYLFAQNILSVQTTGLESQLSVKQSWDSFNLNLILGNQLIQTINPSTEATRYLSNRPRFLFSAQVIASYAHFTLAIQHLTKIREGAQASTIEATLEDRYSVWHAKLSYQFRGWGVFVQGYNLGDVSYQDILGAPLPQRWIAGGIQFRLQK